MALDSKELLLGKFVSVNKERYPEFSDRLDRVSARTITFDSIGADPNNPEKGRMSNLGSGIMFIEAQEQIWECASLNGNRVLKFTEEAIFPSLDEVANNRVRGIYKYQDGEEVKVAQLIPTLETDFEKIIDISLLDINSTANYRLRKSEITMLSSPASGYYEALVDGTTIHGVYTIVCKNPDLLAVGDWTKGYFGQVLPSDFISPELVAELVGIPTTKIIYREQNLWLKFSYKGKIILIAQKPAAYKISYDDLINLNLIKGNRVLTIKDVNYGVRVPIGDPGVVDYNEWEDLIYPMSEKDPTGLFWEHFTDDELGVGVTAAGGLKYMGEWNWVRLTASGITSPTIRGGSANGITGVTTASSSSDTSLRGFRPVLVMEGVEGIDEVSFKQINPRRLIPLQNGVPGRTDAYPVKNVIPRLWKPVPVYFSTDFLGDVYRITRVQTKEVNPVTAPILNTTELAGAVSRILSLTMESDVRPVYPSEPAMKDTIKGIFSILTIKTVSSPPVCSGYVIDSSNDAMPIRHMNFEPIPLSLLPLQPQE